MAFTTTATGNTGPIDVYNIDWSVGLIGSNIREDVMLVQALFRILYYELMGFNDNTQPPPDEPGVIEVDGLIGPVTRRHIKHFQAQMAARGTKVTQDGSFDPFRAENQLSTRTHSRYSLELLNNGCLFFCEKQGLDNFSNLPNRADMPAPLRAALKTRKKTARQYVYVPQTVPTTGGA
ncbi:peptidoglycan-binding protein [Xenophilus aerolatus]|nr:peptidoglycan-binding protein [Xenophilus aerolatus]